MEVLKKPHYAYNIVLRIKTTFIIIIIFFNDIFNEIQLINYIKLQVPLFAINKLSEYGKN